VHPKRRQCAVVKALNISCYLPVHFLVLIDRSFRSDYRVPICRGSCKLVHYVHAMGQLLINFRHNSTRKVLGWACM
jgi:hypothetical protein